MSGLTADFAPLREDAAPAHAVPLPEQTPTRAHPLAGVAAVALSLILWGVLAFVTNWLVKLIIGTTSDRWSRWQGVTVLIVTLIAAVWAVSRVANPAEKFD